MFFSKKHADSSTDLHRHISALKQLKKEQIKQEKQVKKEDEKALQLANFSIKPLMIIIGIALLIYAGAKVLPRT